MTNTKWLRKALMGGAALTVMGTAAHADELTALKAQLDALNARLDSMESQQAALPQGGNMVSFKSGQGSLADWGNGGARDAANVASGSGFTIDITPTADMPAPVAEITVYGYVKGDVIYDFDYDFGNSFYLPEMHTSSSHWYNNGGSASNLQGLKDMVTDAYASYTSVVNNVSSTNTNVVNGVSTTSTNVVNGVNTGFTNVVNGVNTTTTSTNVVNGVNTTSTSTAVVNGVTSTNTNVLNGIATTGAIVLDSSAIAHQYTTVVGTVSSTNTDVVNGVTSASRFFVTSVTPTNTDVVNSVAPTGVTLPIVNVFVITGVTSTTTSVVNGITAPQALGLTSVSTTTTGVVNAVNSTNTIVVADSSLNNTSTTVVNNVTSTNTAVVNTVGSTSTNVVNGVTTTTTNTNVVNSVNTTTTLTGVVNSISTTGTNVVNSVSTSNTSVVNSVNSSNTSVVNNVTDTYQGRVLTRKSTPAFAGKGADHIRLHAQQSRFGIKSKVDTAVGQIRTLIEGDFWPGVYRLRHAWGEWDMTPNWTLGVGQYWQTAALLPIGITTVDFSGPAGPTGYGRRAQVRLTYADGPLSWAVAIERPTYVSSTNMPNVSSYIQYDVAGGHQFIVTGTVADWNKAGGSNSCGLAGLDYQGLVGSYINGGVVHGNDIICEQGAQAHNDRIGWAIQAGGNVNLGDIATLTGGVQYGEGEVLNYMAQQDFRAIDANGNPTEALGATAGLSFAVNEATSFNVGWGYAENLESNPGGGSGQTKRVHTVHANILWQPVKQMRLGWEVMWGQMEQYNGAKQDALRAQFGAWFFF